LGDGIFNANVLPLLVEHFQKKKIETGEETLIELKDGMSLEKIIKEMNQEPSTKVKKI
jgi:hypothetical protein